MINEQQTPQFIHVWRNGQCKRIEAPCCLRQRNTISVVAAKLYTEEDNSNSVTDPYFPSGAATVSRFCDWLVFICRNVGLGLLSVFNRVGGVLAPQIVALSSVSHDLHFVLFGVLGAIAAGLTLLLPETLGKPLPETPEDIYTDTKKREKDVISMTKSEDRQQLLEDEGRGDDSNTVV